MKPFISACELKCAVARDGPMLQLLEDHVKFEAMPERLLAALASRFELDSTDETPGAPIKTLQADVLQRIPLQWWPSLENLDTSLLPSEVVSLSSGQWLLSVLGYLCSRLTL